MSQTFDRRTMLATLPFVAAGTFSAQAQNPAKPMTPWQWTDENGLIRTLPKDREPLKDELAKFPRCRYCGMERAKFTASRHLIVYDNDAVDGTCSLHCAAIGLSLNMDNAPKAIYVGDAGADGDIKPLTNADTAFYVLDPSKPGVMTKASNFAFAVKAKADAAAVGEAAVKAGAKVVGFNDALRAAYGMMAEDTIMLRARRGENRRKAATPQ